MTGELHKTPFKAVINSDNQAPLYSLKILIYLLMIIFHLDGLNNSFHVRKPHICIFIFPLANTPIITFRIQKNASDSAGVMFFAYGSRYFNRTQYFLFQLIGSLHFC